MRILCRVLRAIGVSLGLFLVATSLASISGLMAGFGELPLSSTGRLLSGLPLLIFGVLLVLPQSFDLRGKRYSFLILGYVALIIGVLPFSILGVVAYYEGNKHWMIIPTSLALVAVPISNALVLWYLRRRARTLPDTSYGPKRLRDSV